VSTDTAAIRVIEHDELCSWCGIRLSANGLPPIRTHRQVFHTSCIGAYALDARTRRVIADVVSWGKERASD
jgi:hypothetical protein